MTIQSLYDSGRFPHAILLIGDTADNKEILELYGCNPADVVFVKEEMPFNTKKTAKPYQIEPLRRVVASGNYRPQFGDIRVFVFNEFDTMSEICQNALLKFIEEPHEFNRFVMTARSKSKILPTILSRVVTIQSQPSKSAESAQTDGITKNIVAALLRNDEYTAAVEFAKVKDWVMLSEVLQSLLQELLNTNQLGAADIILRKYIQRVECNPHIQSTAAACVGELQKEINL